MRRPFIAGNWKMNLTRDEAESLARDVAEGAARFDEVEIAICPPSVFLALVAPCLEGTPVGLGAQNIYFEANGAYTGEISAAMIKELGCQYTILGHSERRQLLGETDEVVNKKVHAALAAQLVPIVCLGETLDERHAGQTSRIIQSQFKQSLAGLHPEQMRTVVIAYEPIWAIGTGQVATPEQAQQVHAQIRSLIVAHYGQTVADVVRIQYGGSVKPTNAGELLAEPDIDGALVGGASLTADSFLGILEQIDK